MMTPAIQSSQKPASFYGWNLVAALWAIEFLNMGFPFYGGGVINTYMLRQIAMDRTMFGLGFTVCNFCIGAPSALIVASILRFGLRTTFVIGSAFLFAGSVWLSAFTHTPMQYLFGFGVLIGIGIGFGTVVPLATGVTRWFRRYRGRAMAIAFSASGFAGFVGAPLLNRILAGSNGNFHQAWRIVALISLISAVVAWFFVKESPEAFDQTIDGEYAMQDFSAASQLVTTRVWTPREAFRTPVYWLVVVGAMGCQFPFFFFNAHAVLHMKGRGISPADAAWALGLFTGVGILGRFLGGALLERIAARWVFILGLLFYVVGSALELRISGTTLPVAFCAAACYGFAFGCSWIALNTITGNFFGVAAYPRLNGTIMMSTAVTCAPAGIVGGRLFDLYRSYNPAFELNAMIAVVAMVALFFARMPKEPGQLHSLSDCDCGSEKRPGRIRS